VGDAKFIIVKPIDRKEADALVKRIHYSGKVVNNSQLHLGVFIAGKLEGAMQFGPSLDKEKIQGLIRNTHWNGFIELNRMAFSERLPRNSESRALSVALRLLKKHAPHIEWVITFADGAQCGDGTIYRAAGAWLTGIKKNNQTWAAPTGDVFSRMALTDKTSKQQQQQARKIVSRVSMIKGANAVTGGATMAPYIEAGFTPIPGFQLRYILPLVPGLKERATFTILNYSEIEARGAGMYKGNKISRPKQATSGDHLDSGGAAPTRTLHLPDNEAKP
jgi:hypothetical protein